MPDAISLSIRELPARDQPHQAITARLRRRCESDEEEVIIRYRGPPNPTLLPGLLTDSFVIYRLTSFRGSGGADMARRMACSGVKG